MNDLPDKSRPALERHPSSDRASVHLSPDQLHFAAIVGRLLAEKWGHEQTARCSRDAVNGNDESQLMKSTVDPK